MLVLGCRWVSWWKNFKKLLGPLIFQRPSPAYTLDLNQQNRRDPQRTMLLQFCLLQAFPSQRLPSACRETGHQPIQVWHPPIAARLCASCWSSAGVSQRRTCEWHWENPASDTPQLAAQMWWWKRGGIFCSCPNVHKTAETPRKSFSKQILQKFVTRFWNMYPLKRRIHQLLWAPLQTTSTQRPPHKSHITAERFGLKLHSFWWEWIDACQDDVPTVISCGVSQDSQDFSAQPLVPEHRDTTQGTTHCLYPQKIK